MGLERARGGAQARLDDRGVRGRELLRRRCWRPRGVVVMDDEPPLESRRGTKGHCDVLLFRGGPIVAFVGKTPPRVAGSCGTVRAMRGLSCAFVQVVPGYRECVGSACAPPFHRMSVPKQGKTGAKNRRLLLLPSSRS